MIKSLRSAIRTGDPAVAGKLLRPTISAIDRAVAKASREEYGEPP